MSSKLPGDKENKAYQTLIDGIGNIRRSWSPSLSPDEEQLAFLSDMNGTTQVWIISIRGGCPQQVTAINDDLLKVTWSPDGKWLALLAIPYGGRTTQIYIIHPDGTDFHCITRNGAENNWLGPWSKDGNKLAFSSNQDDPTSVSVFSIELDNNHVNQMSASQGASVLTDWSPEQTYGLLFRMINRSDNDIYLINFTTGVSINLTPHNGLCNFHGAQFSPKNTIYMITNQGREFSALGCIHLTESMQPTPLEIIYERDDAELESIVISLDGKLAALVWNVIGRSEIEFLDLTTLKMTPGPKLQPEIVHQIEFSKDGHILVIQASGASMPSDIWVFYLHLHSEGSQLFQRTFSPHPGINLDMLVSPKQVCFPTHDNLMICAWYYQPNFVDPPYPVVISFHGGPEAQERPEFNDIYQAIIGMGIAILAPNVRGSTGYGRTFSNLDNGPLRLNAIQDIKSCVEYLNNSGLTISSKIGLLGESYGGFMVMSGLVNFPQLFACGVTISGIVNMETFFANTEPWMAEISKIKYGDPIREPELLRRISPIHKLNCVTAPTLVIHGAKDTNVSPSEAEQVVSELKRISTPVNYLLLEDEGHGLNKKFNRNLVLKAIVDWLRLHLTS